MAKSIIKEFFIMLLLCIAIVLILGVVFYEYIPTNKAIPNPMSPYTTPEDVKAEIDEEITESEQQNITYTITGKDLNLYKQQNSYIAGKENPFAASPTVENSENAVTNNVGSTGNNGGSGSSSNTNNNNTDKPSDNNSTGTFYNTGLK